MADNDQTQGTPTLSGSNLVNAVTGDPSTAQPVVANSPTVQQAPPDDAQAPDASQVAPAPSLAQALSSIPSNGPTDMPRFQRTVGSTLKGMLFGLMMGGPLGAVAGAVSPTKIQQVQQTRTNFQSAQAAEAVAQARRAEVEAQNLPQDLRDQHDARVDAHVAEVSKLIGPPDEVFDNSSEAAQEAMQNHIGKGGIPLAHIVSNSDSTYAWHAGDASKSENALSDINKFGILNGIPTLANMTEQQYRALPPEQQSGFWQKAMASQVPLVPAKDNDDRTQQKLANSRQLATVSALPDTNPQKAPLLALLQGNQKALEAGDKAYADTVDEKHRSAVVQIASGLPAGTVRNGYLDEVKNASSEADLNKIEQKITQQGAIEANKQAQIQASQALAASNKAMGLEQKGIDLINEESTKGKDSYGTFLSVNNELRHSIQAAKNGDETAVVFAKTIGIQNVNNVADLSRIPPSEYEGLGEAGSYYRQLANKIVKFGAGTMTGASLAELDALAQRAQDSKYSTYVQSMDMISRNTAPGKDPVIMAKDGTPIPLSQAKQQQVQRQQQASLISVTAPDGSVHQFKDQASANKFKNLIALSQQGK